MIWDDSKHVAVRVAHNRQTAESFWARVDRSGDECWEWQGAINGTGYGAVGWHGRTYSAHRVAAWLSGIIPQLAQPLDRRGDGHVLHECDNRKCCRPDHLYVGTYSRNQLDAYARGRRSQPSSGHVNAKLSPAQVLAMRAEYKITPNYAAIGRRYGVNETTAANAIKGRRYVDVG